MEKTQSGPECNNAKIQMTMKCDTETEHVCRISDRKRKKSLKNQVKTKIENSL